MSSMGPLPEEVTIDFLNAKVILKILTGGTAALDEQNSVIEFQNGASDYAFTIPPDSGVDFPIGSWMIFRKTGSGEITLTRGSGVIFRGALGDINLKLSGEDGFSVYIEKTNNDVWLASGSVKAV